MELHQGAPARGAPRARRRRASAAPSATPRTTRSRRCGRTWTSTRARSTKMCCGRAAAATSATRPSCSPRARAHRRVAGHLRHVRPRLQPLGARSFHPDEPRSLPPCALFPSHSRRSLTTAKARDCCKVTAACKCGWSQKGSTTRVRRRANPVPPRSPRAATPSTAPPHPARTTSRTTRSAAARARRRSPTPTERLVAAAAGARRTRRRGPHPTHGPPPDHLRARSANGRSPPTV